MTTPRGARLRRVGWLLTPLVVWAASFCGAWVGALAARLGIGPWGGVSVMVVAALVAAVIALLIWLYVVRRLTTGGERTAADAAHGD